MAKHTRLVYYASRVIVDFCAENPIDWHDRQDADMAGDWRIQPPAMSVFFDLLAAKRGLFTQGEFLECAQTVPMLRNTDPYPTLTDDEQRCFRARLARNFYPSGIDTLHAWSLLVESGRFAHCVLDTADDAINKVDMTATAHGGGVYRFALRIDSPTAEKYRARKDARFPAHEDTIDVLLPMSRPRNPGNKRWYQVEDFEAAIARSERPRISPAEAIKRKLREHVLAT